MTIIDSPQPTTYDVSDFSQNTFVNVKTYRSLDKRTKDQVKGSTVKWYLKHRNDHSIDDFLERFEGKTFSLKRNERTYHITSDIVQHVVHTLEKNLSRTYGEAVGRHPRSIDHDGLERMYAITQKKVEDVERRLPVANPRKELSFDSLREAYAFRIEPEKKSLGGGFVGGVKRFFSYFSR